MQKRLGTPEKIAAKGTWVQTERAAHEAWAQLAVAKPRASALLHILVSRMGSQNAVVISQKLLARLLGASVATTKRALADLAAGQWIQMINLGPGTTSAYVVNSRVAWAESRGGIGYSVFSATVVAERDDQDQISLATSPLRRLPVMFDGEQQLPSGRGLEPPAQQTFDDMLPDLPSLSP